MLPGQGQTRDLTECIYTKGKFFLDGQFMKNSSVLIISSVHKSAFRPSQVSETGEAQ